MYAVAARLTPRRYLDAGHGHVRRDGAGRHHHRRRVPLPAPRRRTAQPYADPNEMGAALVEAARRAGIRITLLDTLLPDVHGGRRAAGRGAAAVRRRRRRTRWAARVDALRPADGTPGIGAAVHSRAGGAGRPDPGRRGVGRRTRRPAARPPVRAARRERGLPGVPPAGPRPRCSPTRARSARARPRSTPPTSPTATAPSSATPAPARACARPPNGTSPTVSARRAALRRRRQPAQPRQRQPRGHRPLRGGARGGDARAAAHPSSAGTSRPPSWSAPPRPPGTRVRLGRRRRHRRRPARRPGDCAAGQSATAGIDPAAARLRRDRRRREPRGRRRPAGRRDGRHVRGRRAGRAWRAAIEAVWAASEHGSSTTSASWSPTTRRWARARSASAATRRSLVDDGRVAWVGAAARRAGRRPADRRRRAAPCCPASSTATRISSSPGTGRPSSPRGWPASRTPAAASAPPSPPPGPPATTSCAPPSGGCASEALRQGTTTIEIKSGYGLSVPDEARSLRIAREFTDETTFLGAHVVPAEYADRPDDYVALVCGPMLRRRRPVRPLGRRVLRTRRVRRATSAGHPDRRRRRRARRAGARQPARARARASSSPSNWAPPRADHCTHLSDADVDALAGSGHGGDAAAGRGVLDPVAVPGRPRGCSTPGDGRAGDRLQPRLVVHHLDGAVRGAGGAGDAHDPGRGGAGRRPRVARGRCAATTSACCGPARGPTLIVLDAPSYLHLAYRPGVPLVHHVLHNGVPT